MAIEPKQSSGSSIRGQRATPTPAAGKIFKKFNFTIAALVGLVVLTLASSGSAVFFYLKYQDLKNDPSKFAVDENRQLLGRVGKLMLLPENETPTIATVTDLAPFKGQPFFANAKIGDKVIIYSVAKRAILYDPANDKIVEVAPLNLNEPANANAPAPTDGNANAAKK